MKKTIAVVLAVMFFLSFLAPISLAEKEMAFDYAGRKMELKQERQELFDWYSTTLVEAQKKAVQEFGIDAILLGPTPESPEKYIVQYRSYNTAYRKKAPSPNTLDYEDEFYSGRLKKTTVNKKDTASLFTDYLISYVGTVTLKDQYKELPKNELEEKMVAYYKEKAAEPVLDVEAR